MALRMLSTPPKNICTILAELHLSRRMLSSVASRHRHPTFPQNPVNEKDVGKIFDSYKKFRRTKKKKTLALLLFVFLRHITLRYSSPNGNP